MTAKKKAVAAPVQDQPNLIIEDKSYPIASLPKEVQEMLSLYQRWGQEKVEAQIEVNKCDAAQRALSAEIATRVRAIETSLIDQSTGVTGPA